MSSILETFEAMHGGSRRLAEQAGAAWDGKT